MLPLLLQQIKEEQVRREAEIAKGVPIQQRQMVNPGMISQSRSIPPNVYGAGSAGLQYLTGLMQNQGYAKGGHVENNKYKSIPSGQLAKSLQDWQDLQDNLPSSPYETEMLEEGRRLRSHQENPTAQHLITAGLHQLGNLRSGDQMKTFAEAQLHGMNARQAAKERNLSSKEKYMNLLGAINKSRLDQHQVLAAYHQHQLAQEEAKRHHGAMESHQKRAYDLAMSKAEATANNQPNYGRDINTPQFISKEHEKSYSEALGKRQVENMLGVKKTASDKKSEHDAVEAIKRAHSAQKEADKIKGWLDKTTTGPIAGRLKNITPFIKTKTDNNVQTATRSIIIDMHQAMKNIPRSEGFLKMLEETKPSVYNHKEANDTALHLIDSKAKDVLVTNMLTLLDQGWTPQHIEKKLGVKVPQELLEDHEAEIPSSYSHAESSVKMITPEGIERMVPSHLIDEAIAHGGTLVE